MASDEEGGSARQKAAEGEVEATVHWVASDDGARLAVTRVQAEGAPGGTPAVLVHGNYAHRGFWLTDDGGGLAPYLARAGYDVWVPELRGHGLSPKAEEFAGVTAEDHTRRDLPAVQEAVAEATGSEAVWVAHSAGGLYLLGALGRGWLDPEEVRAVAVFGTQIDRGEAYLENRLVGGAVKGLLDLLGYLPAPRLGMGPEVEPAGEMKELIDWKARGWVDGEGVSYRDGLAGLDVPVRAYAGAADSDDPPEGCRMLLEEVGSSETSFVLLGEDGGFGRDYGHAEMVASSAAAEEVWPDLRGWLDEQAR